MGAKLNGIVAAIAPNAALSDFAVSAATGDFGTPFASNSTGDVALTALTSYSPPTCDGSGDGCCFVFCLWGSVHDTEEVATTLQATNETSMEVNTHFHQC